MFKKLNTFFVVCLFLAMIFVCITYYRYVVKQDYYVLTQSPCDPKTESCFERKCGDLWWFECTGDPENDISIYKYEKRKAYEFAYCDPVVKQEGFLAKLVEAKECPIPECDKNDVNCSVIYCDSGRDSNCYKP